MTKRTSCADPSRMDSSRPPLRRTHRQTYGIRCGSTPTFFDWSPQTLYTDRMRKTNYSGRHSVTMAMTRDPSPEGPHSKSPHSEGPYNEIMCRIKWSPITMVIVNDKNCQMQVGMFGLYQKLCQEYALSKTDSTPLDPAHLQIVKYQNNTASSTSDDNDSTLNESLDGSENNSAQGDDGNYCGFEPGFLL